MQGQKLNLWAILSESGGRRPDPERLEGLDKMVRPHTKKELRKLLGTFGYYGDYIDHFAEIVKPLTDLTSKKVSNQLPWKACHQQAYELLRDRLRFTHVLRFPKIERAANSLQANLDRQFDVRWNASPCNCVSRTTRGGPEKGAEKTFA